MTEQASIDLPSAGVHGVDTLNVLEGQVARASAAGDLCELQWDAVDTEAVAQYCRTHASGSVTADGYEALTGASRFGRLQLQRQVCAHHDGRPHVMPGNALLPRGSSAPAIGRASLSSAAGGALHHCGAPAGLADVPGTEMLLDW